MCCTETRVEAARTGFSELGVSGEGDRDPPETATVFVTPSTYVGGTAEGENQLPNKVTRTYTRLKRTRLRPSVEQACHGHSVEWRNVRSLNSARHEGLHPVRHRTPLTANEFCAQLCDAAPDTGARPSEHGNDWLNTRLSKCKTTTRMHTAS